MIGRDCDGHPLHPGDKVWWIHDERRPPELRTVLGRVEESVYLREYSVTGPEQGYMRVSARTDHRGYHHRFGINLRLATDPDLVMDEGL